MVTLKIEAKVEGPNSTIPGLWTKIEGIFLDLRRQGLIGSFAMSHGEDLDDGTDGSTLNYEEEGCDVMKSEAQTARDEAKAPALKVYHEATAQAGKAYEEVES